MQRLSVAIIRGGPSQEHDVSMRTGAEVLSVLAPERYRVRDIIVTRAGDWIESGFQREPLTVLESVDVVFIALHGLYGEDGTLQRQLERAHVPYTGSGPYPSAIAMNKLLTKEHLKEARINMAPHMKVSRDNADLYRVATSIESLFGPEYVIKPINGGSSIDVRNAAGVNDLYTALTEITKQHEEVLVEQRLIGKEATVGVVERFRDQSIYRLPAIEIVPPAESLFFDYENKYNGKTEEICPGRFSKAEKTALEDAATMVHQTLGLAQYSRSDFIVTADGVYFLEVNTLPGLTSESLLPRSLSAVGCSYSHFIEHLLLDAYHKGRV